MQSLSTATTVLSLLLGAIGALVAIYLKEAVQQALQRRTLAWQLFAYVLNWRKQIARTPALFTLYEKVKSREADLRASFAAGTDAFTRQMQAQNATREEIRREMREAISASFATSDGGSQELQISMSILALAQETLLQQRKDLVDGKTFLTDKEAAQLGKLIALNVVQLRASLQAVLAYLDALPAAIQSKDDVRTYVITHVVDQLVMQGEDFLEAIVRLERAVDRISKQSVLRLTWEVLSSD